MMKYIAERSLCVEMQLEGDRARNSLRFCKHLVKTADEGVAKYGIPVVCFL